MASPNRGLGKGLGSLIPNIRVDSQNKGEQKTVPKELGIHIPVNKIEPNSMQPRVHFGHHEMEELVESIKKHGVLAPVIVRKKGEDQYELIAGERRWRASQLAGLKTIPALLREVKDQEKLEIALIENIQRKDLTPIEEALSYKKLSDEFNLTHDQVAKRLGKSRSQISNTLRLLSLPQEVRDALHTGKINFGHAKILLGLESSVKQLSVYRKILVNRLSVRDSEKMVRTSLKKGASSKSDSFLYQDKIKYLRDALGTKVEIQKKGAVGKLMIEFYSESDLDVLIQKLT